MADVLAMADIVELVLEVVGGCVTRQRAQQWSWTGVGLACGVAACFLIDGPMRWVLLAVGPLLGFGLGVLWRRCGDD